MAKKVRLIAGLLITIICFIYIFWNFDWAKFFKAVKSANFYLVALAFFIYFITFFLRSYRWRRLISRGKNIHIKTYLSLNFIGYMFNIIFPARAGDFLRAYWISVRGNFSKGMGLASIISERVFDILTIFIILEYLIFTYKPPGASRELPMWVVETSRTLGILLLLVFICLIFILIFSRKIIASLEKSFFLPGSMKEKIRLFSESFFEGMKLIFKKNSFLMAFFYTILIWVLEAACAYLIFKSLSIGLSFYVAIFAVIVANIAGLIPASPGQLGIYEASMVLALSLFGIPKEISLSCALIIHVVTYIVIFSSGLLFLWKEGWTQFSKIPESLIRLKTDQQDS